jgi:hypothetical protein
MTKKVARTTSQKPTNRTDGIVLPGADAFVSSVPGQVARLDHIGRNPFKKLGGSESHYFNSVLFRETLHSVFVVESKGEDATSCKIAATSAALAAFKSTDEIEGMLAAQAVAMHFGAMECLRRAMINEQPAEIASKLRKDGANLARGMTDMLEALDRKRGKGPQVVRVERVVVHEGGQAIVGNVQAGTQLLGAASSLPQAIAQNAPAEAACVTVKGGGAS